MAVATAMSRVDWRAEAAAVAVMGWSQDKSRRIS
jgi:hypothetical protein